MFFNVNGMNSIPYNIKQHKIAPLLFHAGKVKLLVL